MKKEKMGFIGKIIIVFLFCATSSMAFFVQPQAKIRILTTLFPLYEFAQAVCGERGEVDILIPPGAEVHSWKPKPSDIIKIA
ncbi:MAG: zinc ABC transporter substrate-binding protein, partial [Candidatus Aminicenantes bacterium]|nr:zinc ABC transporter substrate-binding protein [Candidatus Aminicenantes bacterium]